MWSRKEEKTPLFVVMPHRDTYGTRIEPRICYSLEEAGKVLFDYPTLYGRVYEIGKKVELEVHLAVFRKES